MDLLIIIIMILLVVLILLKSIDISCDINTNKAKKIIGVSICGILLCIGSLLYLNNRASELKTTIKMTKHVSIISLERNQNMHGSFILGSGYIDSSPSYLFYTKNNDLYKLEYAYTSNCFIKENSLEEPSIEKFEEVVDISTFPLYRYLIIFGKAYKKPYYILTVPEGTIIKEFKG